MTRSNRVTTRRAEEPAPATAAEEKPAPKPLALGWRVAIFVWVLAFGSLLLVEVGAFVWKSIRAMW